MDGISETHAKPIGFSCSTFKNERIGLKKAEKQLKTISFLLSLPYGSNCEGLTKASLNRCPHKIGVLICCLLASVKTAVT
jgi:hypothetical protein